MYYLRAVGASSLIDDQMAKALTVGRSRGSPAARYLQLLRPWHDRLKGAGDMRTTLTPWYDAAVVLGAAVAPEGHPSPALLRRVSHAAALYHRGMVGNLLLSGGGRAAGPTEAAVMRQVARTAGVPDVALVMEDRSRSTLENAHFCKPIIEGKRWRHVLVVTDAFHLPRALYTFRRLGLSVDGAAAPRSGVSRSRALVVLREAAAMAYYLGRVEWAVRVMPPTPPARGTPDSGG